jgi:hypothetical protein
MTANKENLIYRALSSFFKNPCTKTPFQQKSPTLKKKLPISLFLYTKAPKPPLLPPQEMLHHLQEPLPPPINEILYYKMFQLLYKMFQILTIQISPKSPPSKKKLEIFFHKITTEQIQKLDAPPTSKTSKNRMNTQNIQKYNHKKNSLSLSLSLSHTHTHTHTHTHERKRGANRQEDQKEKSESHPKEPPSLPSVVVFPLSQCITNIQATFHREKPPIQTSNANTTSLTGGEGKYVSKQASREKMRSFSCTSARAI